MKGLVNYLTPTCSITYKEGTHFANTATRNTLEFGEANAETGTITGTLSTYIYVGVDFTVAPGNEGANYNPVSLTVTLDESLTGADYVTNYAEATYSVDISLTHDPAYQVAYVTGSMDGWNTADDSYEMVLNIESGDLEWMWLGELPEGAEIKAHHENGDIWSSGDNLTVPAGLNGVYWKGTGSDQITTSNVNN